MQPKKLTDAQINRTVGLAIQQAVDFVETEIAPERIKAQKYFEGRVNIGHEEGRSKVVATKCRDTVRAIKPALMRVFMQSGEPVEFVPRTQEGVEGARQATKYAGYTFHRNDGFSVLSDVFHDALVKKVGIAKAYYDEAEHVEIDEYTGLNALQMQLLEDDEGVTFLEVEQTQEAQIDEMGMEVMPASFDARVAKVSARGQIKIKSVAPEDFFVDRSATSLDDCYVCGHTTEGRVSDLVALGFDFERVYNLGGVGNGSVDEEEELARNGWDDTNEDENAIDPSMRKVLITEAYMRMDIEGTGVARLYKFLCAGSDYEVLDYELCDYMPFAVFEVDPEPHTFFGRSLVDIIVDDQDAATSMMRGLLDNIAMVNNPALIVNEQLVTMDDVLNNEIGRIIRTNDINAVREIVVGSAATGILPALQFYDEAIRAKTGVSGAAMGLDADALQSQTAAGVNAAVQAATAVSELIARTLAEGGMKQLFRTIAQIARQNPDAETMMRIDGDFVPVDPRSWSTDMDMKTNVGIGNNQREERLMTLQQVLQLQIQTYGQYGPNNGLVSLTNIRNTVADVMKLGGVHDANRYMQPMNEQIEQQRMQAAAQAASQQPQSDPASMMMQAEMGKAQIKAQTDMQKAAMDYQRKIIEMVNDNNLERDKMAAGDDLQRDKMDQDMLLEVAKILGQYGMAVDTEEIRTRQNAPRDMGLM